MKQPMKEETKNNFKQELKNLLEKYNVSIVFCCDDGSDTYGLTGEHIAIESNDTNEVITKQDGYCFLANDIV